MAELRANQINLNNFLDDQAQTTQRVLSNQAETESANQQKFRKIDDEIKSTTNNLEKNFNDKVDDIREGLKMHELIDLEIPNYRRRVVITPETVGTITPESTGTITPLSFPSNFCKRSFSRG